MKMFKLFTNVLFLCLFFFFISTNKSFAQLQSGNVLVGGDIADFNLGLNNGNPFTVRIDPKVATFIADNFALGGYLNIDIATQTGATNLGYGIGPLARYYLSNSKFNVIKHSKLFFEGNVGFQGTHNSVSGFSAQNTNGLGFGFGPGFAYFITSNVSVEALLKYNGNVGFGSQAYAHGLNLGVGFQVYLPTSKVKGMAKDASGK